MFTCQTQRQRTSLQTVFVHPVWCLKCSLCPRWNCLAFQENPIWICRAEWGASIESLNDVHTDPPFPVDLLAKFLGFLTGALPETNFCLQMRCNYMQLLADLFVFSLFNCVWYRGKPITIMEVIYSVNPGWTLSRFLLEPWMPIFRGKLAELVSGSKRMTWAPWSGHFSSKALPDCWGVILAEWEHY